MAIEIHVQPPRKRGLFGGYEWRIAVTDDSSGEHIVFRVHGGESAKQRAQADYTKTLVDIAREYPAAEVGAL